MNCVVYSLTRRVFHARKVNVEQDPRKTPPGSGKESSAGMVVEMSVAGSYNSVPYGDRPSPVEGTQNTVAVGKSVNHTSPSELHEGVTMESTWEVRTEEAKRQILVPESFGLGHRASIFS